MEKWVCYNPIYLLFITNLYDLNVYFLEEHFIRYQYKLLVSFERNRKIKFHTTQQLFVVNEVNELGRVLGAYKKAL